MKRAMCGGGSGGGCALCRRAARAYCASDGARLCWSCDASVHGANFLVARHPRALLCRSCGRPTTWIGTGPHLPPAASLCLPCLENRKLHPDDGVEGDGDVEEEEEEEEEEEVMEDEGEGEEQVVPWVEAPPGPPAASTSGDEEEEAEETGRVGSGFRLLKRVRENADHASQDSLAGSPRRPSRLTREPTAQPKPLADDEDTSFASSSWPAKDRKAARLNGSAPAGSPRSQVAAHLGVCRPRETRAIDLVTWTSDSPPI